MASAKLLLFTSKKYKDGTHPIMLRTIKDRKPKYVSTGYSCKPEQWDITTNLLKEEYPKAKKINHLLTKKKSELQDVIFQFENEDKNFTAHAITQTFRGSLEKKTVMVYLQEVIERMEDAKQIGNATVYKDLLRTIKLYQNDKDLYFSDISFLWLTKFEEDFKSRDVQETSISVYMRTLRALMNRAIKEGCCKQNSYPFDIFKISKYNTETRKRAISKEEMLKIIELDLEVNSTLWHSKNYFLFSFYCMGINLIDMAFLRWVNFNNNRITYKRIKTGKEYDMLIQPRTLEILKHYNKKKQDANDYVFPFLNDNIHKTENSQRERIKKVRKKINKDLKAIASSVEIKDCKTITHYVARHSWATIQKKNGNRTSVISEGLGHPNEKTTQIYLDKFENIVLDEANANLI